MRLRMVQQVGQLANRYAFDLLPLTRNNGSSIWV